MGKFLGGQGFHFVGDLAQGVHRGDDFVAAGFAVAFDGLFPARLADGFSECGEFRGGVGIEGFELCEKFGVRRGVDARGGEGFHRPRNLLFIGGDGGQNVLGRHIDHGVRFDRDEFAVILDLDFLARSDFLGGVHAVFLEEGDVLGGVEVGEAVHSGGQVVQPAFLGFLHPLVGVVVAVEDDSAVFLHHAADDVLYARLLVVGFFQFVGEIGELVGDYGVEHGVGAGNGERRAQHPELELVARESQR